MHGDVRHQRKRDVCFLVLATRIASAVTIATFFQPDEYYQALEPAWQLVFGRDSGAWITWVRRLNLERDAILIH